MGELDKPVDSNELPLLYKTSKIEMLRSWARWTIHSLMSAGGGGTSPSGRRSRYSAPVEHAVAHSPQPAQRA
jgi:hypothetical protein